MQYRARVKGKEPSNASVIAYLYYEQRLLQEESARRLDACLGDHRRGVASGSAGGPGEVQMAVDYPKSGNEPSQKQVKTGFTIVARENMEQPDIEKYLYKAEC